MQLKYACFKKKSYVSGLFAGILTVITFNAYAANAPDGAESLPLYGHPKLILTANSAAGGALFSAGPYSININPALTGGLQCPVADLGFTLFIPKENASAEKTGHTYALGLSYPTRMGVWTGFLQGDFLKKSGYGGAGDGFLANLALSRDITENLFLGISLSGGGTWREAIGDSPSSSLYIGANVGAWYRIPKIAFLRNVRFALSLQNLGKTFFQDEYSPIGYPGFFTIKAGAAAHLVDLEKFKLGLSFDAGFPFFDNFLLNTGLQAEIANIVYVSAGWDWDAREDKLNLPFVGVGVKFSLNTSGSELLSKRGFNQTDFDIDAVWQERNNAVELFSLGAEVKFGVDDVLPPDIKIGSASYE